MTRCMSHITSRACIEVQGRLGKCGPCCLCSSRPEWKFSSSRKRVQIWGRKLTSGHSCSTQPTFGKHPRANRPQEGGDKNSSSAERLPCASRSREALQKSAHPSLSSPRGRRCHALYLAPGRLRTMQPAGSMLSPVTCSSAAISAWCYQLHKRKKSFIGLTVWRVL